VPEDDDELDQDVETPEAQGQTLPDRSDAEWKKLQHENRSLRGRLRRSEIEAKHGKDVAELIPEEVPLSKWEDFAEKLAAKLSVERSEETQQREEAPAPKEELTPEERNLAAASGGTSGSPAAERISAKSWMELNQKNPAEARRLLNSGGVILDGSPNPRIETP
jgi:hypothetical protein